MERTGELSTYKKTLFLGLVSLTLGILATWFFFDKQLGVNYLLFILCVTLGALILAYVFVKQVSTEQYVLIALTLFFALMIFVRASELLTFFNFVMSALLAFITVRSCTGRSIRTFLPINYIESFFLPLSFIGPLWSTFPELFAFRKSAEDNSRSKEVARGSLMAVIAVVIFSALFASADQVFDSMLGKFFSFDETTLPRVIFTVIVTAFFIGAFGYLFKKIHAGLAPAAPGSVRSLGSIETSILLGAINLLFLVFIGFQFAYLFGGNDHVLVQGLTYADYARKGFFELVIVAILSYLIISVSEKQIVKGERGHLRSFKFLSSVLVGEIVIILISAFMRLSLYESAYGFTVIRLYSHGFMIWLALALAFLAVSIWQSGKREAFALYTFTSVLLFLFIMNVLNPDAFIAKQNIERYRVSGKIDANYLGHLSSDAIPYTVTLLDDPQVAVHSDFAWGINSRYYEDRPYVWQEANLSKDRARRLLIPKEEQIEEYRHTFSLPDPDPL